MDTIVLQIPVALLVAAVMVTLVAGFIKGAVGFAMPMVMISGISTFLPADTALAMLILPTLLTNGLQAFRQGGAAVWSSVVRFRVFLLVGLVALVASAQLYRFLSDRLLFALIGGPVFVFSLLQLVGWRPVIADKSQRMAEGLIGAVAGLAGGISGVWGPPTVLYLTAIGTPKSDQMRVQGVIYGLGAVVLLIAHVQSGVVTTQTLPLSALMLIPALAGMWVGLRFHDRLDPARFRRATLAILMIAGLNLVRKAVFGG